jgi:hypothetical protein
MLKGLLLCAAACAAPTTVMAGEKDLPSVPNLKASLAANDVARSVPGRKVSSVRPSAYVPIAYRGLERGDVRSIPVTTIPQAPLRAVSVAELQTLPSWHLASLDTESNATSARGGSWAVHDTLSDHRKPRFRRSAFSTMLVLRIDGQEDSAPLSVGGGGVAAALWQAVPGN